MSLSEKSKKPDSIKTGKALSGVALELLFKEKVFFALIVLSTISLTVIYAIFIVLYQFDSEMLAFPFRIRKVLDQLFLSENYLLIFTLYLLTYFSITFFNTALTHAAISFFNGQKPSVNSSIQFCLSRFKIIMAWSIISSTIGFILKLLRYRKDLRKFLPLWLIVDMGWSLATYFVIPILVVEEISLKEAIKRSGKLFKDTWGERIIAHAYMGLLGFFIFALLIIPLSMLNNKGIIPVSVVTAFLAISGGILTSSLSGAGNIICASVYQYSIDGPTWFNREAIQNLFVNSTNSTDTTSSSK